MRRSRAPFLALLTFLLLTLNASAQYELRGTVTDKATGETVIGAVVKVKGEAKARFFGDGGVKRSGSPSTSVEGTFDIALKGQVGHERLWNYVALEAKASVGLTGKLEITTEKDAIYAAPSVKFPGLEFEVSCETMVMKVTNKAARKWKIPERELYPGDSGDPVKWKLVDPKAGKPSG